MYLNEALREFRRLEDTDGIAATLKDLTLLALARGDRKEAAFNGKLLLGVSRPGARSRRLGDGGFIEGR